MPNYLFISCSDLTYNSIKYMHLKYFFQINFHFFVKSNWDALLVLFYKARRIWS